MPVIANPWPVRQTDPDMSKRFYLTTAIDYVNGQPHVGHAYEKVIADVIARSRRSLGQEVFFLTGLDEHGQKVQQAALAEGKDPQSYCDELAAAWKTFAAKLNLSNDDFIRTTEARHQSVVQAMLWRWRAAGQLYKAEYRGFYSNRQETFLTDKDRRPDGTFDPLFGEVVELTEENYYFKLQPHQAWLIDYIEARPDFVYPSYRRNEVLGFLKNNALEDLCITRPASRLSWGIPLPFDPNFVTYVWLDALINYVSLPASHGDPTVLNALDSPPADRRAGQPSTPVVAGGRPCDRQGHPQIPRRVLADHAQNTRTASARQNSGARLLGKGRRENQQEHRQHRGSGDRD